jgi:ribosomal protein S18 acetylase RimI-like enzyme
VNHDLDDIASSFRDGTFLVAVTGGAVVGTGALIPMGRHAAQVVRMSVERYHRRNGIARSILDRLLAQARADRRRWVVLETNADWRDAIAFYQASGFATLGRALGGVGFVFDLQRRGGTPRWPASWLLGTRLVLRHYLSR